MHILTIKSWNCIRMFGTISQTTGWSHTGKEANGNILFCVLEGECQIKTNEKEHYLSAGEYVLIPKGHFYIPKTNSFWLYHFFNFRGAYLGTTPIECVYRFDLPENLTLKDCFIIHEHGKISNSIQDSLKRTLELKTLPTPSVNNEIHLEFFKILDSLSLKSTNTIQNTTAQEIYQYLINNINTPITLSDLSLKFGYSTHHITRLFKASYGVTPITFIIDNRLEQSINYLTETSMSVSEISQICGFENSNYYIRLFRQKYSTTPQKYRKSFYENR